MVPEPDDVTPVEPPPSVGRFRLGPRAVAADALCSTLATAIAALLSGSGGTSGVLQVDWPMLMAVAALQLAVAEATALYRQSGQVMWPLRLAFAAVTGAATGGALVGWSMPARSGLVPALWIQVPLFALSGMAWRAVVGLRHRREWASALARRYGGQDLVVQGERVSSMSGAILSTWRYRHLLANLVVRDLKLKYQRSVLGFAWSLLNPLIMIGVYTVAFTMIMRLPTTRFVLFILTGLLAWNFFADAVSSATAAVSGQGSLLRSVVFPRVVLPFAVVLFALVQYLLTIAVFLPAVLFLYGVPAAPRMLLFPVFLLLQLLFTAGLALALSTAAAAFRDVKHLVEVGIGIGFWATPIVYEPTLIPETLRRAALLSPVASFIRAYQDIFYYGTTPDVWVWIVATVYGVGAFVCGLSIFLAYEAELPEMA